MDGNVKPSGMTPMTSDELPFTRTVRPITRGSAPKRSVHSAWLEDHDRRRALDRVAREDGATEFGRDADHVEHVAVGEAAVVALRLAVASQVGRADW